MLRGGGGGGHVVRATRVLRAAPLQLVGSQGMLLLLLLLGITLSHAELHLPALFSDTGVSRPIRASEPVRHTIDWQPHITQWLSPWAERGITKEALDLACDALANTTHIHEQTWRPNQTQAWDEVVVIPFLRMLPVTFRVQVYRGRLYIEDLHALRPWRSTTPGPKLLLLEVLRRYPNLPEVDAIFTQWDNPLSSRHAPGISSFWSGGERGERVRAEGPFPVFSPSTGPHWNDLPYPDFTFMYPQGMDKMGTPRWAEVHEKVIAAGRRIPFGERIPRGVFSGNCGQTEQKARPRLKVMAEIHPELMFVSDVNKGDLDRGGSSSCFDVLPDPKGVVKGLCSFSYEELCRFKYLINASVGGTYSGRLKYLFLCGSVVIQVKYSDDVGEFYEKAFTPGKHYHLVDTPEEIPALIEHLEANPEKAEAMASAGRKVVEALSFDTVCRYMFELFTQYAERQRFAVQPSPRAVPFTCEDDLYRHYKLLHYVHGDNATCTHPPQAPFLPPGYGGAFDGTGVDCRVEGPPEWPHEFCACPRDDPLSVACQAGREPGYTFMN